tara:strand:- start:12 stop:566 length:555 start_codon:yes stop_codon:yes gene_type:complete
MTLQIHPTHTRKNLIEITEVFDLPIVDYSDETKTSLARKIESVLEAMVEIERDDEYFYIENIHQLKEYLSLPNQFRVTVKEKDRLIDIAKDILFYSKMGYLLSCSVFDCIDDIREKADEISFYGNIPTINRSLLLLNKDPKINPPIVIIQSGKVKLALRKKKEERLKRNGNYDWRQGKYTVKFD